MSTTQPAAPPLTSAAPSQHAGLKLAALAAGFVMSIVDTTVINVAGPSIRAHLGLSVGTLTWAVDGYTLSFASLLLLAGSLATRYGAKRVYQTGILIFIAASLWCGLAPDGGMLVAGRLIQGVGAALCMPSSLGLLAASFPDAKQRSKMIGYWSSIISGSAALGPVIGGIMVTTLGWRSIFMLNIPIGLIGFAMTARTIRPVDPRPAKFALVGHVLSISCLAALCFVLIEGSTMGWSSPAILGAIAASLALGVAYYVEQGRVADPILPRSLFRNAPFSAANGVSFLLNFGQFGMIYMFGLFLQMTRGASPLAAGFELLPIFGMFILGNLLYTRVSSKAGNRRPMFVSMAVCAISVLVLTSVTAHTPFWLLGLMIGISSLGIGVAVPAMTSSLMEAAGPQNANAGGATLNATRQIGTMMGVAVVGNLLSASSDWYSVASTSFLITGVCYAACSFLAWRFIRGTAA